MEIILIVACIVCCVVCFFIGRLFASKPIENKNEEIRQEQKQLLQNNERLKEEKKKLEQEYQNSKQSLESSYTLRKLEIEGDMRTAQGDYDRLQQRNRSIKELNSTMEEEYQKKQQYVQDAEKVAEEVHKNRMRQLDKVYQDKQAEYKEKEEDLQSEILMVQDELDSLKKTRAATIEAARQEQKVKEEKEFYRLGLLPTELEDIEFLNSLKRKLNFPQTVGKIIWSTFLQKKTSNLAERVLGKEKVTGIYKITNQKTQEAYIGQSVDCKKRLLEHVRCMCGASPTSSSNKLYSSFQQTGLQYLTYELLLQCSSNELNEKEKYFIELYQTNSIGLNITKGNLGKNV